jgi:hypothetical protein
VRAAALFALPIVVGMTGLGGAYAGGPPSGRGDADALDRSLDDPQVRVIRERIAKRSRRGEATHPPFTEIPEARRELAGLLEQQAAREAAREESGSVAERRASRTRHRGLGRDAALELARHKFPKLFSDGDGRILPLRDGEQVMRYTGRGTAVVESGDGRSLVDSTSALRVPDEHGDLHPVDITLRRAAAGWTPVNAAAPVSFGDSSSAALSFAGDFTVAPAGDQVQGVRAANEVFFADVARDTDAWFGPTATGGRVAYQLRSADSPEDLRLNVRGTGLTLRVTGEAGSQGVEILRAGERVGSVSPPLAFDADQQQVDVAMRAEGDEIVIDVPHRSEDVLYPIAVDPVMENQDSWKYGNANRAGWRTNEYQGPFDYWFGDIGLGNGYGVGRWKNQWYNASSFGEWQYNAPNGLSYIHRADFIHPAHWANYTTHRMGMWSIFWGGFQHSWATTSGYNWPDQYISICADGAATAAGCDETVNFDQSRGNYVLSSLSPYQNGFWADGAFNHFGGARIWMSDMDLPELWYWMDAPTGWVRQTPAGPYNGINESHVRIGDPGLGMWGLWMDVPGKARQYSTDWGGCSGTQSSRCVDSRAHNFSYAGMSEGIQTVTVTGQDVLGKTRSFSKTLKIDRTRPSSDLSGTFSDSGPNATLRGGTWPLRIDAEDLADRPDDEASPIPTIARSGVASIEIQIDGTRKLFAEQTCPQNNCTMTRSWDFRPDDYPVGEHEATVLVRDVAGNTEVRRWDFAVERTAGGQPPRTFSLEAARTVELTGGSIADHAGFAVSPVGDVNEDGVDDFAIGAPGVDARGRQDSGTVYVVYGRNEGRSLDLSGFSSLDGFRIDGAAPGDFAGTAVSAAGDVNGDGYPDLLVGAPRVDLAANTAFSSPFPRGAVFVVFGQPGIDTGVDLAALGARGFRIDGPPPSTVPTSYGSLPARPFGSSLSKLNDAAPQGYHDVNDDGLADIALGSSAEGSGAGAAYLVFGRASTGPVDLTALGTGGYRIAGAAGDLAGYAVALIDDVNNDDLAEVAVTVPGASWSGRAGSGGLYVTYGRANAAPVALGTLGSGGYGIFGQSGDRLGTAVTSVGDLDRDGLGDLAAAGGASALVFGKSNQAAVDTGGQFRGFPISTSAAGLATDISAAEDADGDGMPDLVIGDSSGGTGGRAGLLYGKLDGTPVDLDAMPGERGIRIDAGAPQDAGASVAAIDSPDGSWDTGVAVGSPTAGPLGRPEAGTVRIVPGPNNEQCFERITMDLTPYDANGDGKVAFMCGAFDTPYLIDERSGTPVRTTSGPTRSSDPEAQAAHETDGQVQRGDYQWQYDPGRKWYGYCSGPRRCVRSGSTSGGARIALDGRRSYARMSLRWRSGPAILQRLSFKCRRERTGPDANCKSGVGSQPSASGEATDYNNGTYRLPNSGRGVPKNNVAGNTYFYEFRHRFLALNTPNTRNGGEWGYPDDFRLRYSHNFKCGDTDCKF